MVWIRCHCGTRKLVRPGQENCSRRCAAVAMKVRHGQAWHALNGRRAGLTFGQHQADRTIAVWQAKYPGISAEAVKAIRAQGYSAGYNMGRRAGWRQALKESA